MFYSKISNIRPFECCIKVLHELIRYVNLDITSTGIHINALCDSGITIINLFLSKKHFLHYEYTNNIALGLDLYALKDVLKCSRIDDTLEMKCSSEDDKLHLIFSNKS